MTFKQFVTSRAGTRDEVGNLVRHLRREWHRGTGLSECKAVVTLLEHLANHSLSPYSGAAAQQLWAEYMQQKQRAA